MKRHDTTLTQEQKITHTEEQLTLCANAYADASKLLSKIMDGWMDGWVDKRGERG